MPWILELFSAAGAGTNRGASSPRDWCQCPYLAGRLLQRWPLTVPTPAGGGPPAPPQAYAAAGRPGCPSTGATRTKPDAYGPRMRPMGVRRSMLGAYEDSLNVLRPRFPAAPSAAAR